MNTQTKHDFDFGLAKIEVCYSEEKQVCVVLLVQTPKDDVRIHVTKSGKVRVHNNRGEMLNKP